MSDADLMHEIDRQLSHVWMVRAFLKHSDEAEEDEDLCEVHRALYDYMLALGGPLKDGNSGEYLKLARKKLGKLARAAESFTALQPQVSTHTNFQMAAASLNAGVAEVRRLLGKAAVGLPTTSAEEQGAEAEDWSE